MWLCKLHPLYACNIIMVVSMRDHVVSSISSPSLDDNNRASSSFTVARRRSPILRRRPSSFQTPTEHFFVANPMKQIHKITAILVAISATWIALLQSSLVPSSYTWVLPIYCIVSLGCYGLLMVGVGLMKFPTCPQEAILLQQDIVEAKGFLRQRGVDVGSD